MQELALAVEDIGQLGGEVVIAYASLWNLTVVLALFSHSELLHFKPDFQEWIFGGFVPLYIHIQRHGLCYSQPSGNYHLES